MAGNNNFLQWNPNAANQESDAAYKADSMRSGGAGTGAIFPSVTANKAFFQWSTFIAAMAASLAAKNYNMLDSNFANLQSALNNLITTNDYLKGNNVNGYYEKMPTGRIMQWGQVTTDISTQPGAQLPVYFPISFTTLNSISVVVTTHCFTDRITYVAHGSVTLTGFTIGCNDSQDYAFWQAMGY